MVGRYKNGTLEIYYKDKNGCINHVILNDRPLKEMMQEAFQILNNEPVGIDLDKEPINPVMKTALKGIV